MSANESQRRIESLERLLDVTRLMAVELDLDTLLQTVVGGACRSLECDRATIYLYDEDAQELVTKFVTELEVSEIRLPISEGVAGQAARTRQVRHVENVAQDVHHAKDVAEKVGYVVRNMIAAPLVSMPDDRLVGVIQVLNKLDDRPFAEHDEQLLTAFASHAAIAIDRARLLAEYKAKQEIEASLKVAREIQYNLFPDRMPELSGYDLAGRSEPCDATGGDYYDAFPLANGKVALVLADVSGHGMGPSLLMATARSGLHALALEVAEPHELLTRLNRLMSHDLVSGSFITFFYGVLDAATNTVAYCNAGQGPVWRYEPATDTFVDVPATDPPLGIDEDWTFSPGDAMVLAPGDTLILPSDGIVEAMNPESDLFTAGRLQAAVRGTRGQPCEQTIAHIFTAVEDWVRPGRAQDDVTLLVARRADGDG